MARRAPDMNRLLECLRGVLEEAPRLVETLRLHVEQLGDVHERLSLVERATKQADQASIARIINSRCSKSDDRVRPIRLLDGSLPLEPYPQTLGEFEGLSKEQLVQLAQRYGLGDGDTLPEGADLRALVFEYLGIKVCHP
ncbi:unnamed protein product [Rhizoctonia solani]|uniref:Uncharacterized protein n=1 Tax=Rhizoctonia solani TaxID=456999 RepID=A0A8H3A131_9AGAM|nr:unnamed protein product [Rhizoctonia solani]